jgi:hypothetical protein
VEYAGEFLYKKRKNYCKSEEPVLGIDVDQFSNSNNLVIGKSINQKEKWIL